MFRAVLLSGAALLLAACGQQSATEAENKITADDVASVIELASSASIYDRLQTDLPIVDWLETEIAAGNEIGFADPMDAFGYRFVELALSMGQLDGDYVDAYHGPEVLREKAEREDINVAELAERIATAREGLKQVQTLKTETPVDPVRAALLDKLLRGMATRLEVIADEEVAFDTEVTRIYDEAIPVYDLTVYDDVLARIDALLPGDGPLYERVDGFRNTLAIPKDKLQAVFDRAIAECRARTQVHFDLPAGENFRMEFVTDKAWSGYNYYQGGYESLIQINTDFPIIIDRAVDLGCHEGYPGHHVWNLFIERELVGKRGWIEYSVNPLFGPFGPIAEGSANYGIKLAFPGDEKITFEKEVLFPMAGLDPALAQKLDDLNALTGQLSHATNEIARQYLDGKLTAEEAVPLIQKYYLASTEKSQQRLRFIDKYRAYVINYNIGLDRAGSWVEAAGADEAARWAAFEEMLTRPMTPSDIIKAGE